MADFIVFSHVRSFGRFNRSGEAGRIQASQTTADLLCSAGKENWIHKRPDKVGFDSDEPVNTFWVHAKTSDSMSTLSFATNASKSYSQPVPKERMVKWFSDKLGELLRECTAVSQTESEQEISDECSMQIQYFVEAIDSLYPNHPFHNFEHAFHVASSLSRMMDQLCFDFPRKLPKFAVMFAALISELDHPGLDNEYLTNDQSMRLGEEYKGKSITQKHAFELAWIMFSDKKYDDLRSRLCPTDEALGCFRRLVHDFVLATDVMNPMLSGARKRRWETVFEIQEQQQQLDSSSSCDLTNPTCGDKAVRLKIFTILEHLMLTAHLTHTTQEWRFYIDWNERLFQEVTVAFVEGKLPKSPSSDSWYNNELMLFDNVVIPLADRLKKNDGRLSEYWH